MSTATIARCRCGHMHAQHQQSDVVVKCMVPHCDCQRFRREPLMREVPVSREIYERTAAEELVNPSMFPELK